MGATKNIFLSRSNLIFSRALAQEHPRQNDGTMIPSSSPENRYARSPSAYPLGASIYREGEVTKGLYRVLQGTVKLCKTDAQLERDIGLYYVNQKNFFGLLECLLCLDKRRCTAVAADEEVIVQYISLLEFEESIHNDLTFCEAVLQYMIHKHSVNWRKYCGLQAKEANQYVHKSLHILADELGLEQQEGRFVLAGFRRPEIAEYVGLSRQSVSGALSSLRKAGVLDYNLNEIAFR